MAFRIPCIPKAHESVRDPDLKIFDFKELSKQKEILGKGSFGIAYKTQYLEETVVVKELLSKEWSEVGKKFIKEAKIMQSCQSAFIVHFNAVSYSPLAIMMEYVYFDFTPLGGTQILSSLDDFLEFCDVFDFKSIEQWPMKIANDVVKGLSYLHSQGIACRDLKPSNVLVSNKHYLAITCKKSQQNMIKEDPIRCKLTDFGEARSQLLQTKTLLATKTKCVNRGTLSFMAPEIVKGSRQLQTAAQADLERIDLWALGMLFRCLISPDSRPFLEEIKNDSSFAGNVEDSIMKMYLLNQKPKMTEKYLHKRLNDWSTLFVACELANDINPYNRALLDEVESFLGNEEKTVVSMDLSQATALEKFDSNFAVNGLAQAYPENDGTNCCSFLCLKIANSVISLEEKVPEEIIVLAEHVISTYPIQVNPYRRVHEMYEPVKALELMRSFDKELLIDYLDEGLFSNFTVFSRKGMADLLSAVKKLQQRNISAVYVCEPYAFLITSVGNNLILIDTHPVPENCGGSQNGIVVFSPKTFLFAYANICTWIWKRLSLSGIKPNQHQSLSIIR